MSDLLDSRLVDVVADKETSRDAWLEVRRSGLGGSDAAAVADLSPWRSRLGLYLDKRGELDNDDGESERMAWGKRLEPVVAAVYAQDTGRLVLNPQFTYRSRSHPFMLATPDRLVVDSDDMGGLEVKTTSAWQADSWAHSVPDHYALQCQHYMAVTGLAWWDVSVLIGGNTYRTFRLHRDDRLIAALIDLEERFWTDHVEAGVPPPVSGVTDDLRFVEAEPAKTVVLPDTAVALIADRRRAHEEAKRWTDRKAHLDTQLRGLLLDAEEGYLAGHDTPAVTWKEAAGRDVFDTDRFAADHPHLYAQYTTSRPGSRRLLVK